VLIKTSASNAGYYFSLNWQRSSQSIRTNSDRTGHHTTTTEVFNLIRGSQRQHYDEGIHFRARHAGDSWLGFCCSPTSHRLWLQSDQRPDVHLSTSQGGPKPCHHRRSESSPTHMNQTRNLTRSTAPPLRRQRIPMVQQHQAPRILGIAGLHPHLPANHALQQLLGRQLSRLADAQRRRRRSGHHQHG
jgi:hypothetical protein